MYVQLGTGGTNAYGSYDLAGGTLNIINASGTRIGYGGLGSFLQTGGTFNCTRYLVVGGNDATPGSVNNGVATFLGGTTSVTGYYIIVGNLNPSYGVMNVGTLAGGNAVVSENSTGGVQVAQVGGSTGVLNLDSGILEVSGPIQTAGVGTVNLNGGTLQAGGNNDLLNISISAANLYNGGVILDSRANNAMFTGTITATGGNGIYPAGGGFSIASGGGSNYIGAPIATVTGRFRLRCPRHRRRFQRSG